MNELQLAAMSLTVGAAVFIVTVSAGMRVVRGLALVEKTNSDGQGE